MKLNHKELNEFAAKVHAANIKWWQDVNTGAPIERNRGELVALIISELSEALEGERKNLMDDKLPHRKMAEVEMADAYIRVMDFCGGFNILIDIDIDVAQYPDFSSHECKGESIGWIMRYASGLIYRRPHDTNVGYVLMLIEAYCDKYGYDLWGAIDEKMKFNATREDHKHEARRIAGGKQF